LAVILLLNFTAHAYQQQELFTINSDPTSTEEFLYFFRKNNRDTLKTPIEKEVQDYMNLFVDFKLKIMEARKDGYDTTRAFKKELKIYLGQLSDSYMRSEEGSEQLVLEAYNRMKEDVDCSHILIRLPEDPSPADTLAAYNKALSLYSRATNGEDFGELATNFSEEPYAKISHGKLGYFTVFQMIYPFESAAYNLKVGEISRPVRTQFGYHIIKLNARRPAMGTINAAHIMIRLTDTMNHQDSLQAKEKIFAIYDSLKNGGNWDALCKKYSDDVNSKLIGGRIRPFGVRGINLPDFENSAYQLDSGNFSEPFMTRYGWHIIKINGKNGIKSLNEERGSIERKIENDSRSKSPEIQWVAKMKQKYNYQEFPDLYAHIVPLIDTSRVLNLSQELFSTDNVSYTNSDFKDFINNRTISSRSVLEDYYNQFVEDKLKEAEEKNLEKTNFEYRMLKKEYYQGILLFAIMEDKIWKKAESDTTGLHNYYEQHESDYIAHGKYGILIKTSGDSLTNVIFNTLLDDYHDLPNTNDIQFVKNWAETRLSGKSILNLTFEQVRYRSDDPFISNLQGGINMVVSDKHPAVLILADKEDQWIQDLRDIKGLVISNYQKELEDKWVSDLRKKYIIKYSKKGLKHVLDVLKKTDS